MTTSTRHEFLVLLEVIQVANTIVQVRISNANWMSRSVQSVIKHPAVNERHEEHGRAGGELRVHELQRLCDIGQELGGRRHVVEILVARAHLRVDVGMDKDMNSENDKQCI